MPQENVFNGAGCGGANISPEFHWSGVAEQAARVLRSPLLIPMLRFPEDGGIGSSLISLEQFRDCLRVQATRGRKLCRPAAFNAGMTMANRATAALVLRPGQPIATWSGFTRST